MKKKIQHANDENKALFNWLTKTKTGKSILKLLPSANGLQTLVTKYAKAHKNKVAGLELFNEDGMSLNWVTWSDLRNTLNEQDKSTPAPKIKTDTVEFKGKSYETREVYMGKEIGWVTVARTNLQKVLIEPNTGGLTYVNRYAQEIDESVCYYANEQEFLMPAKELKKLIYGSNGDQLPKQETYFSIRTVTSNSETKAITKICDGEFDESHPLCDKVLTREYLLTALNEQGKSRYFLFGEQNVRTFIAKGMSGMKRRIQKENETAYTHEHKPTDDLTDLLNAMDGCFEWAELTKKEYDQIQKL